MTFSDLITGTIPHYNKYNDRGGQSIARLIQHHHAATSDAGLIRLTTPSEQASASYVVMDDGNMYGQVPEEFRPWTSGGMIDYSSVTIEVQNSTGQINNNDNDPGSWKISDAALNSIILLLADVAKRNNFASVNEDTYQGHRLYQQTACPGGYLWSRMSDIRSAANFYLNGSGLKVASSTKTYTPDEQFFIDLNIPLP